MIEFIKTQIESALQNDFFQGGFILAVLTWIGYQIKTWPIIIWNYINKKLSYEVYFDIRDEFYNQFSLWYKERFPRKFKKVQVEFQVENAKNTEGPPVERTYKKDKTPIIKTTQSEDYNVVWYKKRLLFIDKKRDKLENANSLYNSYMDSYTIKGLFAKKAIESILEEIRKKYEQVLNSDRLFVYYNDNYDGFYQKEWQSKKTFEQIFFKNKELLLNDLNEFISSKNIYEKNGINYKRGYLFDGPPGTGKTSIAIAMAIYLKRDPYIINISSISSSVSFQKLIMNVPNNSVVIFDDADVNFDEGREMKNKKIDFSTILGLLDGVYSPNNVIFVMITNHKDKFDPAVLRRFEYTQTIDLPDNSQIREYLSNFYGVSLNGEVKVNNKLPMSKIQDICLKSSTHTEAIEEIKNHERNII